MTAIIFVVSFVIGWVIGQLLLAFFQDEIFDFLDRLVEIFDFLDRMVERIRKACGLG